MSFVTTYILMPHQNDIGNVRKLNDIIRAEYDKVEHTLTQPAFREMGCHLPRYDTAEFFAAHLNHFDPKAMCDALNNVEWDYPGRLCVMFHGEIMEEWVPVLHFSGKFIAPSSFSGESE